MSSSRRRHVLLAAASAAVLAGCGFQLRRPPQLSFRSIALTGFAPRSPLAEELRGTLARSEVRIEDNPAKAEVVFQALADTRERSVVATTSAAQVRELQLRVRLRFRTHTPAGRVLTPTAEIGLSRDMSYSESVALAKEYEEADLFREMQSDVVGQVLRRLVAVKL
jgi:LPS-assembly lipoprotein